MSQVNLDALIKRDDLFKVGDDDNDSQEIPDYKELRIDSDLNLYIPVKLTTLFRGKLTT